MTLTASLRSGPFFLFCVLSFLILNRSAFAFGSESKLKSILYSNLYSPTEKPEQAEMQQISSSFWLVFDTKYQSRAAFHANLATTLFTASALRSPGESKLKVDLREGYVTLFEPHTELRFGQQIIPWGKADTVNPTDFLTATDYTLLSPETEVPRIGSTSFWLIGNPTEDTLRCEERVGSRCKRVTRQVRATPWSLNLVWTPVFPKSIVYNAVAGLPSSVDLKSVENPKANLGNSEAAFKAEYAGDGWDFAFVLFQGWNHLPQYVETARSVDSSGNPIIEITPRFSKISAGGIDVSWTVSDWVFVLESAYTHTRNSRAVNALSMPSRVETVVGGEREVSRNLRLNVQALWTFYPKYRDPKTESDPISREVAEANAVLFRYQYRSQAGNTWRLTYDDLDSPWKLQLFVMNYWNGQDFYIQPKITYKWTDALSIALGSDQYGGPRNHALSSQKSLNAVFTEMKYLF